MLKDPSFPKVEAPKCDQRKLLKGQKAIVTGANSGIGEGVALSFAAAGADVAINYISREDAAENVLHMMQKLNPEGKMTMIEGDVSKEEDVLRMFQEVQKEFGAIDILVSNAGIQRDAPLTEMTLDQWNQVIGVNLTGQFLCAREAVRTFMKQGFRENISSARGKILCISSVHEVIPWAGHVNYASSKGGISMMMRSIAQEVAKDRIRVNSICPGAIKTHINEKAWETKDALDSLLTLIPYDRIGTAEDIGRAAVWLASDESDYVTGVSLFVDGGMTLYPGFTEKG